jgi:choline dehydrogenase-like flavoprotein
MGEQIVPPTDPRWHNNAMTVGGGTRVYGAQAWRFCPEDFRMASTYGVPAGSSLADWPISYDDLEPFYDRAEWEVGVAGDPSGHSAEGRRSRGYPMPPLPANRSAAILQRGAQALGFRTGPVPLLINSVPRDGRGACLQCGACGGFSCPGDFKNGTQNTVIARALATGRCDLLTETQAERLVTNANGAVAGVSLVALAGGALRRREVRARHVVLAAGAIESARLLLNSASRREPRGIGNNHDQVGRNLQGHLYAGAIGIFDDCIQDCIGPGPSIATNDFRHHNPGLIGGGLVANDFVPTPIQAWGLLTAVGAIPQWGEASKRGMRELFSRFALVIGPVQEMPNPESRVTLDPRVRDRLGIPVARLSGSLHPEDYRVAELLSDRASEWLSASGAQRVLRFRRPIHEGPSGFQHQAGTCRMGSDPRHSVTDAWGRVWGHDNLCLADGSLHVTNGGVNPVLTILANAYRVTTHLQNIG